jgi:hypothetical protein
MSKYNNANWDHYKLAGRERPGDAVLHEDARRRFSGAEDPANANAEGPHIPNQERASQPRSGGTVAAAQEQAASETPRRRTLRQRTSRRGSPTTRATPDRRTNCRLATAIAAVSPSRILSRSEAHL